MCWRYSRDSEDILRVGKDSRSNERRERLGSHQLDTMAETLFEQLAKPDEPIERLRATNELNQQIDVAIGPRGPVQHRTKEGKPCDTKRTNLVFDGTESLLDTFSGERRRGHAHQCTGILKFGQVFAERPNGIGISRGGS